MTSANSAQTDDRFLANAVASFLQIGALLLLAMWCYTIVQPFIGIVVWGLVISIALYPAHMQITARLGGREKLSSIILVVIGLAVIIVPTWMLAESSIDGLRNVAAHLENGSVSIPPPNANVAEWPVIGEEIHAIWSDAASNLEDTLNKYSTQLEALGQKALGLAGSTIGTAFQFIFSVIIAGVLLMSATTGYRAARNIAGSLVGDVSGDKLTDMSILTIRSVVKGVLGVAVIQTILALIGLVVIGVPAPGLWAGAILVLAIIQLPPLIILAPIAVWVFSVAEPVPATIFAIYSFIVSMSDAFLKPMLLGRGVETPMLVILIGAIGGAISGGIIGLFLGAVILALGYELLTTWMAPDEEPAATADA
jgi:predicted PurR-regulated permease PerM